MRVRVRVWVRFRVRFRVWDRRVRVRVRVWVRRVRVRVRVRAASLTTGHRVSCLCHHRGSDGVRALPPHRSLRRGVARFHH